MGRQGKRRRPLARSKIGLEPGTPIYVGEDRGDPIRVHVIDFDDVALQEHNGCTAQMLARLANGPTTTWINVDGVHDASLIKQLCETLSIHPLWIEDILNFRSRPKAEVMGPHALLVVRVVNPVSDGDPWSFEVEQNSFVLGRGFVLSFQQRPGDPWDPIRARIRSGQSRRGGADFLLHALLDAVVDQALDVMGRLEAAVDDLEDAALLSSTRDLPLRFATIKGDLVTFRSALGPMRDVVGTLRRLEDSHLNTEVHPYLQDLSDHVETALDNSESLRDRALVALELHLAVANQSLNEVIRMLTLVSTIFIPLTFVAGVYGMNFEYMPELEQPWGYPTVMLVMVGMAGAMIAYFRRRGWM